MNCKVIYGFDFFTGKTFHSFNFPLLGYSRRICLVWILGLVKTTLREGLGDRFMVNTAVNNLFLTDFL